MVDLVLRLSEGLQGDELAELGAELVLKSDDKEVDALYLVVL